MALRKGYYGEGKDPQGIPGLENGTGRMRAPREAEFRPLQESQWQIIDWQNCRRMPSPEWERKTARKERCKEKSVGTFGNTLPVGQKRQDSQLREGMWWGQFSHPKNPGAKWCRWGVTSSVSLSHYLGWGWIRQTNPMDSAKGLWLASVDSNCEKQPI